MYVIGYRLFIWSTDSKQNKFLLEEDTQIKSIMLNFDKCMIHLFIF